MPWKMPVNLNGEFEVDHGIDFKLEDIRLNFELTYLASKLTLYFHLPFCKPLDSSFQDSFTLIYQSWRIFNSFSSVFKIRK